MAQILVEFKNKLNYVWENTNLTMQKFGQKLAMFIGAYSKYKEIKLSAADLIAIGAGSYNLLPALPSNQYYEIKVIGEYVAGTVAFDNDALVSIGVVAIDSIVLSSPATTITLFTSEEGIAIEPAQPVKLTTPLAITAGDGVLTIKLFYNIHKLA